MGTHACLQTHMPTCMLSHAHMPIRLHTRIHTHPHAYTPLTHIPPITHTLIFVHLSTGSYTYLLSTFLHLEMPTYPCLYSEHKAPPTGKLAHLYFLTQTNAHQDADTHLSWLHTTQWNHSGVGYLLALAEEGVHFPSYGSQVRSCDQLWPVKEKWERRV